MSLRNLAEALSMFVLTSCAAILDWIQKYNSKILFHRKINVYKFIIHEAQIKTDSSECVFGFGLLPNQ
ncbi:MAG: hypothetical protein ACTHJ7_05155 [Candidatus Nitrosocosmicus sp.]